MVEFKKIFRRVCLIFVTAVFVVLSESETLLAEKQTERYIYSQQYNIKPNSEEELDYYTSEYNDGSTFHESALSYFTEPDGTFTLIFVDGDYLRLVRTNGKTFKKKDDLKLKKPFKEAFGATCDEDGNYYVIFSNGASKKVTFAVAKYNHKGKYIKAYKYSINDDEQDPYHGGGSTAALGFYGNCAVNVKDGLLVCYVARAMNSHPDDNIWPYQTSAVYAINTEDMTRNYDEFVYTSASMDQRVLKTGEGKWLYADLNTGSPGFTLGYSNEELAVPFHCFNVGDFQYRMGIGGVFEVTSGIMLIGYAPSNSERNAEANIFMKIVSTDLLNTVSTGKKHKISNDDCTFIDEGVVWLTDLKDETVAGLNAAIMDNGNIVLTYVKLIKDQYGSYSKTIPCLKIVDSFGNTVLDEVRVNSRLNGLEDIGYWKERVFWCTGYKNAVTVNRIDLRSPKILEVSYEDQFTYTGKPIEPGIKIKCNGKTLKEGKDFSVSYKYNTDVYRQNHIDSPGKSQIIVSGKGKYKDFTHIFEFVIVEKTK